MSTLKQRISYRLHVRTIKLISFCKHPVRYSRTALHIARSPSVFSAPSLLGHLLHFLSWLRHPRSSLCPLFLLGKDPFTRAMMLLDQQCSQQEIQFPMRDTIEYARYVRPVPTLDHIPDDDTWLGNDFAYWGESNLPLELEPGARN